MWFHIKEPVEAHPLQNIKSLLVILHEHTHQTLQEHLIIQVDHTTAMVIGVQIQVQTVQIRAILQVHQIKEVQVLDVLALLEVVQDVNCYKMKLSFFILLLNCGFYTYSQNEDDALRYSQTFLGGTARNLSMGGAMTALGGDFTAGSQNPASMAQFNKNNFSFTPSVEMVSNQADFYGTTTSSTHTALKIGNLSYLKSYNLNQLPNPKGWATMQLGFGINRLNSFANYQQYKGVVDGSIINNFIQEAEGVPAVSYTHLRAHET